MIDSNIIIRNNEFRYFSRDRIFRNGPALSRGAFL